MRAGAVNIAAAAIAGVEFADVEFAGVELSRDSRRQTWSRPRELATQRRGVTSGK
jgi:hypothetical protein